ncbi:GTP-binding protein [Sporothrix brasiliensis 5110]|uniref:GTP-binding protein n=1 Tax=Sporothrix brasiliensis 5110 TaxID=1398154 RepID=A0A0C2J5C0_9PEZI|nr:GTP-binding protein [Sporothrix brasiliensis 5110]KIH94170.1 GTP-binding protein [Sporothrix brasiliensis 5110]
MSSVQLSFNLRVSSSVKTVHLLGSWDNYVGQLPLSKDKSASKSGSWKGTFRFQGETLEAGQRYWYYYIIDGYHASHNPSEKSTLEPTTGRELNVLDVPKAKSSSSSSKSSSHKSSSSSSSSRHSSKDKKRSSRSEIPKGRPLSTSQIKCPKPQSPHATRNILTADYDMSALSEQFAATGIAEEEYEYEYSEESAYVTADYGVLSGSDLSYSSDDASSISSGTHSSMSGYSTPSSDISSCTCERYGITRKGDRVRIDCGGTRCGYEDECSSSEDEDVCATSSRRNGIIVS